MSAGSASSIERNAQKANEWVADLAAELGRDDRDEAWRILRGFLQVLRDRITLDEGAQLAAQMPHLVRGVFYEGFDPGRPQETFRDRESFLALIAERAELAGPTDASFAAEAAMRTLRRHVSRGEVDQVLAQLPEPVRSVVEPR